MSGRSRNNFSNVVEAYAKYRRDYVDEVYEIIYNFCPDKESNVLDLGSGTGFVANHLAQYYRQVTGIDISKEMLEVAKALAPSNANFIVASAEELPFGNENFDLITCAAAFHWFDHKKATQEMHRVLKLNGKACIFWKYVPGAYTGLLPEFALKNLKKFIPEIPHATSERVDENTFLNAGFKKVELKEFRLDDAYTKEQVLGFIKSNSTYNLLGDEEKLEYDKMNETDVDAYLVDGKYVFKALMEMWLIEK